MTLPAALYELLFPSHSEAPLAGIDLGAPVSGLALPPWWTGERGGKRVGCLKVEHDGVYEISCELESTFGRVSTIRIYVDPATGIENAFPSELEKRIFDDLAAAFTERFGKRRLREKKRIFWDVPRALQGDLCLQLDGGYHPKVWLTLALAAGVHLEADPTVPVAAVQGLDLRALAEALASVEWPAERAVELLSRCFSRESPSAAEKEDQLAKEQLLIAARNDSSRDLRSRLRAILSLADWSALDSNDDQDSDRRLVANASHIEHSRMAGPTDPRFVLDGIASRSFKWKGQWLDLTLPDLMHFVNLLDVPAGERASWAFNACCALEWADEEPTRRIAERMKALPPPGGAHNYIRHDSTDPVEARLFALTTAGLTDDVARIRHVLVPGALDASGRARAAASYLVSRGAAPALKVPLEVRTSSSDWATFLGAVRSCQPALADEIVEAVMKVVSNYSRTAREICAALADESEEGEKSRWRIGCVVVQHSGKPQAGRWSIARSDDLAGAQALYAGKKPRKKKA